MLLSPNIKQHQTQNPTLSTLFNPNFSDNPPPLTLIVIENVSIGVLLLLMNRKLKPSTRFTQLPHTHIDRYTVIPTCRNQPHNQSAARTFISRPAESRFGYAHWPWPTRPTNTDTQRSEKPNRERKIIFPVGYLLDTFSKKIT